MAKVSDLPIYGKTNFDFDDNFGQEQIKHEVGRDLCKVKKEGEYRGYRKDILIENLSERDFDLLVCPRCEGIVRDACLSNSGEQLCSCCRGSDLLYLHNSPVKTIPQQQTNPNLHVRKTVHSLKCLCPLTSRGCKWIGTLGKCEDHLDTCGYVYEACKLDCGVVLQRDRHTTHKEECRNRSVNCENCGKYFKFLELATHPESCPKVSVTCQLGCGKTMSRDELEQHRYYECGHVVESCKLGCGKRLSRDDLSIHMLDTCAQRKIPCGLCKEDIKLYDMSQHINKCPKAKVGCGLKCGKIMYRMEYSQHAQQECPERVVKCPFVKYNCEVGQMKPNDMQKHLEEKRTEHWEMKLNAMENIVLKQNQEMKEFIANQEVKVSRELALLYSITNTTKLSWNVTYKQGYDIFSSQQYCVGGYSFNLLVWRSGIYIHFPQLHPKYGYRFKAKIHIFLVDRNDSNQPKQIACSDVKVNQRDLIRGCGRSLTQLTKEDVEKYSFPETSDSKIGILLDVFLTLL